MIEYKVAEQEDLKLIVELQQANLKKNLSAEEIESQGYVTAVHTEDLLRRMNSPYPHIIAKNGEILVGYALVMTQDKKSELPILTDMINEIDRAEYEGVRMEGKSYVIVGQACVAKDYRGQGVFRGLYSKYFESLSPHFDYIVTGISSSNKRSMRAHEKIGFEILSIYQEAEGEWANVIYNAKRHRKKNRMFIR